MGNVVKWYKNQEELNINDNKKDKIITYNSFDLFYWLMKTPCYTRGSKSF